MTAALVDRRVRGCLFFAQFTYLHKKGRESIKGEKSSDGKSINLVDLTFFPLETVLIQLAKSWPSRKYFFAHAPYLHQESPDCHHS